MLSAAWAVVRIAWSAGPATFLLACGEILSNVLLFLYPVLVGGLVTGLLRGDTTMVATCAAAFVGALGASAAIEGLAVGARVRLIDAVDTAFDQRMLAAVATIDSLDTLESEELARALRRVRDRSASMGFCYNDLMSVLIQSAAPLTTIVVAVLVDPRLLLLTVAGVPAVWLARRANQRTVDAEEASDAAIAGLQAWGELYEDTWAQRERAVFHLDPWYRRMIRGLLRQREALWGRAARVNALGAALGDLLYIACFAGVMVWMLSSGSPDPGRVTAALLVGMDIKGTLGALRFALTGLTPGLRTAVALRTIETTATEAAAAASPVPTSAQGIRAEQVAYAYGDGTEALYDVTLDIPAGTVVAVVGVNGAGKTTLSELLRGLRRPTAGRLTLLEGEVSVVAQHFAQPELLLGEAATLGRSGDPEEALVRASARRWWPPLETQLGEQWPEGRSLSEGQWQAVATARGLLHPGQLLVLDEPTSALDPHARETMSARLVAEARQVADRGGIGVIITHTMTIPHRADMIVTLEAGRIAEVGTHEQLLASGGCYATLYKAATAGYQDEEG